MTHRRLLFVPTAADAPAPTPDTAIVVSDATWTPGPGDRRDLVALRPAVAAVVARVDLFEEALARLDAWAEATAMSERLRVDGVTYWYRLREEAWNWLHERLIWSHLVGDLAAGDWQPEVVVAADEPALQDVADAVTGRPPASIAAGERLGGMQATAGTGGRSVVGWLARRGLARRDERAPTPEAGRRTDLLDARVRSIGAERRGPILVLSHTGILQAVDAGGTRRMVDANLGAVVDRLRADGQPVVTIGLGQDHRDDASWPAIEADDRLLPQSLLQTRWRVADVDVSAARVKLAAALAAVPSAPLGLDGADLAAAWLTRVRMFADTTVPVFLRQANRIEALLAELRPRAIVMTHEGIRTPWLVATRRRHVPAFAVQHGVLYPSHPGYRHPRRADLVLPDVTFVFGEYERDVLIAHGGYRPEEVEVSGSPRLDLDRVGLATEAMAPADRDGVRAKLGVRPGARLLVVSTGFLELSRRFYLGPMLDDLLGGPLPGVHIVFKQHPGETDEGPYRAVLEGLARARGFDLSPIAIVRDVDLYRLLRAADAHLGLHSTVLTDAVVTGTPNLIAVDQAHSDLLGYVPAGVATPVRDIVDLRAALAEPQAPGPAARQAFLDAHFRAGDAGSRIAAVIAERIGTG